MDQEVKTFRVEGILLKPLRKDKFTMDVRALSKETAVNKAKENFGSKHKLKTSMVRITNVKEIKPEESKNRVVQQLGSGV
jgi:ribosomal protein L20A (L18A)